MYSLSNGATDVSPHYYQGVLNTYATRLFYATPYLPTTPVDWASVQSLGAVGDYSSKIKEASAEASTNGLTPPPDMPGYTTNKKVYDTNNGYALTTTRDEAINEDSL